MGRGSMLTGKNRWVCRIVVVVVVVVIVVVLLLLLLLLFVLHPSFTHQWVAFYVSFSPLEMALFSVLLERERVLSAHQL